MHKELYMEQYDKFLMETNGPNVAQGYITTGISDSNRDITFEMWTVLGFGTIQSGYDKLLVDRPKDSNVTPATQCYVYHSERIKFLKS